MGKMAEVDLDVRDAIQRGESPSDIARRLNIPTAWVQDIAEEYIGEENLEIELADYDQDDGQPTVYEEYQDLYDGDDSDQGQYDEGNY